MQYQALYRKYRPSDFSDVIGQKKIVKILKNSLETEKFSHAYIFSGPRGTGKTTLAKIFAKNINCLDKINGESCGKCKNCIEIIDNNSPDIIEIDAASNNGVEEIREIKNNINLVPTELNYKVYIIDEVHMLSIGAFNALLKTLEEPPSHVMFILATTDLHKVPITILSRCQCFEFSKIVDEDIVERLKYIVDQENIKITEDVLYKIAKYSDGGMRDSLSLLDKIRSYTEEEITLDIFYEITGSINDELIEEFLVKILNKDILGILNISNKINDLGKDYIIFSQEILLNLRDKIVDYYVNDQNTDYDIDFMLEFANKFNILINNLKNSSNIKIMFETSILTMLNEKNDQNISREIFFEKNKENNVSKSVVLEQKKEKKLNISNKIEEKLETTKITSNENKNTKEEEFIKKYYSIRKVIINNSFVTANKEFLLKLKNEWNLINDYILDNDYSTVVSYLRDVEIRVVGKNEMILSCNYDSILERGIILINKIEKLLELIYNNKYKVALVTTSEWEKEKNQYINSKKNGINYEYQLISNENSDENSATFNDYNESSIIKEAIDIFGEDIVKIQ